MDESIPLTQRPDFWRKFIFWGLFLLFLLAFWGEIWQTLVTLWRLLSAGLSCFLVLFYRLPREGCQKSLEAATLTPEMRRGIFITLINLLAYLGVAGFSIFQAAQFALPVRTFDERMKAFNRILLYLRGQHGPAIFVKEGKANTRADEADKVLPGVALVDLSSAIVLEQQKNTVAWQLNHLRAEQKTVEAEASGKPLFAVKQIVRMEKPHPGCAWPGRGWFLPMPGRKFTRWLIYANKPARMAKPRFSPGMESNLKCHSLWFLA